jgi:cyclopropane fatty-acyl-phospholipid synthase-like methyltransferase
MTKINSWRTFFDTHAPEYMDECFTKNTAFEVAFLIKELQLQPGMKLLDVGCGTGRHSLALARHGLHVTGIDLSSGMLSIARQGAEQGGLDATFIQADAIDFTLPQEFNAAICLCEGAFGLLGQDEDPYTRDEAILKNIAAALKPGAPFLLTALNGARMLRAYSDDDVATGRFDPLSITECYPLQQLLPNAPAEINVREKGFLGIEIRHLLTANGFDVKGIWGGTAGQWNKQPLQLDEMELMIKAKRRDQ